MLTSRVPVGRLLTDTHGYEGGEKHLRSLGVILGEDLGMESKDKAYCTVIRPSPAQIRREFDIGFTARKQIIR